MNQESRIINVVRINNAYCVIWIDSCCEALGKVYNMHFYRQQAEKKQTYADT